MTSPFGAVVFAPCRFALRCATRVQYALPEPECNRKLYTVIYNLTDFAKHAGRPNGGLNRFFTTSIENSSRGAVAGAVNRRRR